MMRVVISDLFIGDCELTGKSETECVRVQLGEASPESVIATKELLRVLRFHKTQQSKLEGKSSKSSASHTA